MSTPIFEQISSALTVRSICTPLGPDIPAGSTDDDLRLLDWGPAFHPDYNPSRVVAGDGSIIGLVWHEYSDPCSDPEDEDEDYHTVDEGTYIYHTVEEKMVKLEPNQIVSSSTTVLEAVELFANSPNGYFYVVHVNEIIGVVFYGDLFKPLSRLAFLALALEIEDQALALCRLPTIIDRAWQALSENRRGKAIELFKLRYRRDPSFGRKPGLRELGLPSEMPILIGCTNLVDKATMIWKLRLVEAASRADVLGFFKDLREVRDRCAHPGSDEELIPKDRLAKFVETALRIRTSLIASQQLADR
jgi:hypothetical protein